MTIPSETHSHRELFEQSLSRCSSDPKFMPRFYRYFLQDSDEIQEKFRYTNFDKQYRVLLESLELSAAATAGDAHALQEMKHLARRHDRNHLDIDQHHYELWLEAVIRAASEFDAQWDAEIEESWRSILGFVIQHMIRSY